MNHPKPEEWVGYVCGETSGAVRRQLSEHLRECRQCREEIESWQGSLKSLDAWKLPRARRQAAVLGVPSLRWAAAAAVVLLLGILIGRASAPRLDIEKVREALAPQIQADVSAQVAQMAREEAARAGAISLASGRRYTDQVVQQLYVALKKDVDTIAWNADAGLRRNAEQLYQLADYKEPQSQNTPNQ